MAAQIPGAVQTLPSHPQATQKQMRMSSLALRGDQAALQAPTAQNPRMLPAPTQQQWLVRVSETLMVRFQHVTTDTRAGEQNVDSMRGLRKALLLVDDGPSGSYVESNSTLSVDTTTKGSQASTAGATTSEADDSGSTDISVNVDEVSASGNATVTSEHSDIAMSCAFRPGIVY
jgi:hypothetical protein